MDIFNNGKNNLTVTFLNALPCGNESPVRRRWWKNTTGR